MHETDTLQDLCFRIDRCGDESLSGLERNQYGRFDPPNEEFFQLVSDFTYKSILTEPLLFGIQARNFTVTCERFMSALIRAELRRFADILRFIKYRLDRGNVSEDDYSRFRQMRFSMRKLEKDLPIFLKNVRLAMHDTEALLSRIIFEVDFYEQDVRDTYQTTVNSVTVAESHKAIEMAEKSIKESERVRICT